MWPYKKNNTILYCRLYLKGVQLGGSFKNIQIKSIIQYNVYNCIKSDCDFKQTIKRFLNIFLAKSQNVTPSKMIFSNSLAANLKFLEKNLLTTNRITLIFGYGDFC